MSTKDILVAIALSGMQSAGNILKAKDTNTTGVDDVVGGLMTVGASAAQEYLNGDIHGVNGALKTIRDSIDSYLATQNT